MKTKEQIQAMIDDCNSEWMRLFELYRSMTDCDDKRENRDQLIGLATKAETLTWVLENYED